MSDTDSFIQEVTEEVRRDQLFRLMRKYGWIAVLAILVLVGGAAYNEWTKARDQAQAEALGDALLAASQADNSEDVRAALQAIQTETDSRALVAMLQASEAEAAGDRDGAVAQLTALADDATLEDRYRHMAVLKLVLLQSDTLDPQDRIERLQPLAVPGAPYRLLAEEQIALADHARGDTEAAIGRLQNIIDDADVTAGLRRRASQLIVALGGSLQPA